MELHQLRYLVAVAEEHHFGRAAEKLYISQPSVSGAVRTLEREFGVTLLNRTSRRVELTEAGRDVVAAARLALRKVDAIAATAERHRAGTAGVLGIGFEATGAGEFGTTARQRFTARYPHVRVELTRFDWGTEAQALREGAVDVAFIWLPCNEPNLDLRIVAIETRSVGVAINHPLAAKEHVSITDLAHIPLMTTRKAPQFWVDWWAVNPRPDGSPVRWGPDNDSIEECFEHVADGQAACICATSTIAFYQRPDIVWIPVTDIEPLRIAFGRRVDDDSLLVQRFSDIVNELHTERLGHDPHPPVRR